MLLLMVIIVDAAARTAAPDNEDAYHDGDQCTLYRESRFRHAKNVVERNKFRTIIFVI